MIGKDFSLFHFMDQYFTDEISIWKPTMNFSIYEQMSNSFADEFFMWVLQASS